MQVVALSIQAMSTVILLITVLILSRQAGEARRAAYAQSFEVVYGLLQTQDVRAARGHVLGPLRESKKAFEDWDDFDIEKAEQVCASYDAAAIMCDHEMLPIVVLADSWGRSYIECWETLQPLVLKYRKTRGNEYWNDFELMSSHARLWRDAPEKPGLRAWLRERLFPENHGHLMRGLPEAYQPTQVSRAIGPVQAEQSHEADDDTSQ